MRVVSLASGSGGNAYCIESCGDTLLVDCGISCRCLVSRCRAAGIDPEKISAVLFTHDHEDHIRGAAVFSVRYPHVALYANWMTAEAICAATHINPSRFSIFENGQRFASGPFSITPFHVPHDVPDPVGFMIDDRSNVYFHATDVGAPLDSIGVHLARADAATLEFNHDRSLLACSLRPECLKRRIRGGRGHLSNDEAASLVRTFAGPRLKALALAHLSRECNEPHLAVNAASEALADSNAPCAVPVVLSQEAVIEVCRLQ